MINNGIPSGYDNQVTQYGCMLPMLLHHQGQSWPSHILRFLAMYSTTSIPPLKLPYYSTSSMTY